MDVQGYQQNNKCGTRDKGKESQLVKTGVGYTCAKVGFDLGAGYNSTNIAEGSV